MHLYMSGTPRNDPYQTVENRLNTHRLFSLHGDYHRAVIRWVSDLKAGIFDAGSFLEAYPQFRGHIMKRDASRRIMQNEYGRTFDYDTAEVLDHVCDSLDGKPYPKAIMLDSGAFTAWNKGEVTTVDDVRRKYAQFIELAGDMFEEIWMINLDVIPGERGRDPTAQELVEAVRVSDINFEILVKEFGDRILPVFHQGEDSARLVECVEQVNGKSNYICVSPRNDLHEGLRVTWSRDAHGVLSDRFPHIMTHGLATTGNRMVRTVPWYSGDSAAWVQHGGYGMIDIFHDKDHAFGRKPEPHYMNYFVSLEGVSFDIDTMVTLPSGEMTSGTGLGLSASSTYHEMATTFLEAGLDPEHLPLKGGHLNDLNKHYWSLRDDAQAYVRSRVEALGFPFEVCRWDSRVRNLICMAEIGAFAEWADDSTKEPPQSYLFGDL